jgi:acyl-CoA synthetase (AMP-forming)/AMP-acid ligase II
MNIISRLEHNAKVHPDKPAFIFYSQRTREWERITFKQLTDSTQRFVTGLQALRSNSGQACSVTPGMRVALMTPPSTDFFALTFAMVKLGLVPVILDPAIGLRVVGECLEESKPDIYIGNGLTHALRILFGWGKRSIKHNLSIQSVKSKKLEGVSQTTNHSSLITDSSPAAIIYTSGSTGIPKGAVYTHANFAAQLDILKETFDLSPDEIDLPAFPLYALIDALIGVTSIIPDITFPVPGKTDPEKVIAAIEQFKVTNMFASPVVLEILTKHTASRDTLRAKLKSLKRIITAGAPATIQLQEKFRELLDDKTDLFGIYGATEVLPIAKVESHEIFELKDKSAKGAGVCLGKPVSGAKVRIIEISESAIPEWQDQLEAPPNVVGEITVQGAAVTESYIAREEANQLSKIYEDGKVIHRMGDVGCFDEQGRLWYCGRKSHRVITNDDVLFTEQIEGIFNVHPLVRRTALVGVNKEPVLWIELAQNADKKKIINELKDLAKDHPQASKIRTFLFMKKFPTDVRHNSKIIREQLTSIAEKRIR